MARWRLTSGVCFLLAALAYGLVLSRNPLSLVFSWLLWPGIALYVRLNGSLIFGGGFGTAGDFLIIVGGSALAWSAAVAAIAALGGLRRRRRR